MIIALIWAANLSPFVLETHGPANGIENISDQLPIEIVNEINQELNQNDQTNQIDQIDQIRSHINESIEAVDLGTPLPGIIFNNKSYVPNSPFLTFIEDAALTTYFAGNETTQNGTEPFIR